MSQEHLDRAKVALRQVVDRLFPDWFPVSGDVNRNIASSFIYLSLFRGAVQDALRADHSAICSYVPNGQLDVTVRYMERADDYDVNVTFTQGSREALLGVPDYTIQGLGVVSDNVPNPPVAPSGDHFERASSLFRDLSGLAPDSRLDVYLTGEEARAYNALSVPVPERAGVVRARAAHQIEIGDALYQRPDGRVSRADGRPIPVYGYAVNAVPVYGYAVNAANQGQWVEIEARSRIGVLEDPPLAAGFDIATDTINVSLRETLNAPRRCTCPLCRGLRTND